MAQACRYKVVQAAKSFMDCFSAVSLTIVIGVACCWGSLAAVAKDEAPPPPGVLIEPPLPRPAPSAPQREPDDEEDDAAPHSFGCPANNRPLELLV